ncbi:hypothetical protein D3C86_1352660 [compost metagenome]
MVQEAFDKMVSFLKSMSESLIPVTTLGISPLAGAVSKTLLIPLDFKCLPKPSRSR